MQPSLYRCLIQTNKKSFSILSLLNIKWKRILFMTGIGINTSLIINSYEWKWKKSFNNNIYNNNYVIAEDINHDFNEKDGREYTLYQYQFQVAEYVENKQFDELIEFLWKELIKVTSSGKADPNIIDFLENKLCGFLIKVGKADEAAQIIDQYSDQELIDNQSLLRVAFIYHSAKQYQRALNLYQLSLDNLDEQLKNKIRKDHLPTVQNEIEFTVNMQMAQCYTALNQLDKVKDIYSNLKIDEIIHYGADQPIVEWYKTFTSKQEYERFKSYIDEYKAQF